MDNDRRESEIQGVKLDMAKLAGKVETLEFKIIAGDRDTKQLIELVKAQVDHSVDGWRELKGVLENVEGRLSEVAQATLEVANLDKRVQKLEAATEQQSASWAEFRGGRAVILSVGAFLVTLGFFIASLYFGG